MNKVLCIINGRKSGLSQIISSLVWAAIIISSSLIVDDLQTKEFLTTMYLAGWFITTMPQKKSANEK